MSCLHSAWCQRDHAADLSDPLTHEARTTVDGVGHPGFPADQVIVVVSYRDGDSAPRLFVSAQADLDPLGAARLQDAVTKAFDLMLSVQPTAALAGVR